MLVAALAATVAVALAGNQQRWLADVANRRDQVQAQSLALAGVQWARQIMQDDARGGTLDYLGEVWSFPLPPTPIANGSIEGRIEDAQGRLNLNNAALDGTAGATERLRLAQLFAVNGLDRRIVDTLADWIDSDSTTRGNGAEDDWYAQRSPASLTANAPLLRTAELASLRGASPEAWSALATDIAALPPNTAAQHQHRDRQRRRGRHSGPRRREARGVHRRSRAQAVRHDGGAARASAARRYLAGRHDVLVLEQLFPGQRSFAPGRRDRAGACAAQARRNGQARGRVADARVNAAGPPQGVRELEERRKAPPRDESGPSKLAGVL